MKDLELFKISHKSNKGIGKKTIFIVVITIVLLLIFIPFTFYKTYKMAVNDILNSQYEFRIINIYDENEIKKLSPALRKELTTKKEVIKIFDRRQKRSSVQGYIYDLNKNDFMDINPAIEKFTPQIIEGNSLKDTNDIICPNNMAFGVFSDMNKNDLTNMSDYLGKNIIVTVPKLMYNNETGKTYYDYYKYKFKLVGLYDPSLLYSYSSCYIKEDRLLSIAEETFPYNINEYEEITSIYISNYRDVKNVTNFLDQNGISYQVPYMELGFLDFTLILSLVSTIILTIISLFILNIYFKLFLKEKTPQIALYKALGYNKQEIQKIVFYSMLEMLLQSLIISFILLLTAKFILMAILNQNITYTGINIRISFLPVIIYFIVCLVFIIINVYFDIAKKVKESVIETINN